LPSGVRELQQPLHPVVGECSMLFSVVKECVIGNHFPKDRDENHKSLKPTHFISFPLFSNSGAADVYQLLRLVNFVPSSWIWSTWLWSTLSLSFSPANLLMA